MNVQLIASAAKDFEELSPRLRKTILKQLELLCQDLRHPSIRAKKYDESKDVWRGRVNRDFRFYFRIVGTTYRILRIIPHPKLGNVGSRRTTSWGRPAAECWRSPPYSEVNARSSSRAASLNSFSGSISTPPLISSCTSRIVLFGAN